MIAKIGYHDHNCNSRTIGTLLCSSNSSECE